MTNKKSTNSTDVISSSAAPEQTESAASVQKKAIPTKKASTTSKKVTPESTTQSKSALSIFALIIAIIAILACAGIFYWQNQQQIALEQNLIKQNSQQASNAMLQIKTLLQTQQANLDVQLAKNVSDVQQATAKESLELKAQVERLSQNQPSDWLLHETEYLIRIAARTIWLEKDTQAATSLLQEANQRIQELNDPHYLPLRQVIHDDIETLKLLPRLETQEVVLTLISLNKQINQLPLAMAKIPQKTEVTDSFELSSDVNDWQANLAKTWAKFLDDFITVSRRTGSVEPLISPEYQQNLRENLSLKLQLAQWAATQENADIYLASLNDVQDWLQDYFALQAPQSILFLKEIVLLKDALITYQYPSSLQSLKVARDLLSQKNILINTPIPTEKVSTVEQAPIEAAPADTTKKPPIQPDNIQAPVSSENTETPAVEMMEGA